MLHYHHFLSSTLWWKVFAFTILWNCWSEKNYWKLKCKWKWFHSIHRVVSPFIFLYVTNFRLFFHWTTNTHVVNLEMAVKLAADFLCYPWAQSLASYLTYMIRGLTSRVLHLLHGGYAALRYFYKFYCHSECFTNSIFKLIAWAGKWYCSVKTFIGNLILICH